MHDVYLSIGSNIEPEKHIQNALEILNNTNGISLKSVSTFYITPPLERPEQNPYRNGVVYLQVSMEPQQLKFDILRPIEDQLGRNRSNDAYEARSIDLDILLFDSIVQKADSLTLPDPDIRTRSFVAKPLYEIAPDIVLPDTGEQLKNLSIINESLTIDTSLTSQLKERFSS